MDRFDGAIAGLGTRSGVRLVVGMWRDSPLGPVTDVMMERPDGHRTLIAPTPTVADYISTTYTFDEVRVEPVALTVEGAGRLAVRTPSVELELTTGRRTAVGLLLTLVPRPLARTRGWCHLIDPAARLARPGVRTVGSAGSARREYYCALDEHQLTSASVRVDGHDPGPLTPVTPPVRFGFGSTPTRPTLVRVTTLIVEDTPGGAAGVP
ncbi:hypothetical protein OKJ48_01465 [Streptomyces kunmingensis]|uniref:Uncharacterized protein n=1 Tax=Streptomyces kunmingensis TaxID=68225 RepID=A0ABU6C2K5_9ACTN|nr:hypothetical protein [Streptomyces kunmingensis]MEB3958930.1 hypothetical protein [Streptomyces kunmingensis]